MTLQPRIVEWMQAEIDGELGERESAELERFLAGNAEARDRFAALRDLADGLDRTTEVMPPAELRARVLSAIRTPSPGFRIPASWRRYGYALAAGVILGVVAYHWGVTSGVDPGDVSGSMAAPTVRPAVLDEVAFDFVGGTGSARVERAADGLAVVVEIDSAQAVDAAIELSGEEVDFLGFRADTGEAVSLQAAGGSVSWSQSGRQRVVVLLENRARTAATIALELSASGAPLHRVSLSLPSAP